MVGIHQHWNCLNCFLTRRGDGSNIHKHHKGIYIITLITTWAQIESVAICSLSHLSLSLWNLRHCCSHIALSHWKGSSSLLETAWNGFWTVQKSLWIPKKGARKLKALLSFYLSFELKNNSIFVRGVPRVSVSDAENTLSHPLLEFERRFIAQFVRDEKREFYFFLSLYDYTANIPLAWANERTF